MSKSNWNDLGERIGVGAIVAAVGLLCVWMGGFAFAALTVIASGVMVWELVRMLDPKAPAVALAVMSAAALIVAELLPIAYALPLVIAPVFIGIRVLSQRRLTYAMFTGLIILAGLGLYILREDYGFVWMLWLGLVVIASDVFGYVFGRMIGGPKLWPKISPNKTWAGTIAGWIGAILVGAGIAWWTGVGPEIIPVSIALAMAAQIGDVAESAVKRRAGVKDSSSLLPGHGGLFDRFDGMLGASVFMLLTTPIIGFPPGTLS